MIRYHIRHETNYFYGDTVAVSHNLVRLRPLELAYQRVLDTDIAITPKASHRSQRCDYFGNRMEYLGISYPHRHLQITASSTIEIDPDARPKLDDFSWESIARHVAQGLEPIWFMALQYVLPSPRIPLLAEAESYARESFRPGRGVIECATDLMHRIKRDFTFDSRATDVLTPTSEIFRKRRGVCQDFAHLQIACLRAMGIPARYVSGYLRTYPAEGHPRLEGADASHAWVACMVRPGCWIEFDPTNDLLPREDHVVLAYGRDFSDVSPVDGVFIGGGEHRLVVSVDVQPIDASSPIQ